MEKEKRKPRGVFFIGIFLAFYITKSREILQAVVHQLLPYLGSLVVGYREV
jgi:hypothetical protein